MKAYQLLEILKSIPKDSEIVYKVSVLPNGTPIYSSLVLDKIINLQNEPEPIAILKTNFKDHSHN